MGTNLLAPELRLIQQADLKDKVVLVRVDHNVVKKGAVKDPYRIDSTFGTLYAIAERGGRPILMSHVGRPKDKKTGFIKCQESESIGPVVRYLEQKLPIKILCPDLPIDPEKGIRHIDKSLQEAVKFLKNGEIGMIYLPNTRWFQGEQAKGEEKEIFARELAGLADLFVNDAFGSWQAHVSTYDIARRLPSYAGILMQKEIVNLHHVLEPRRPFLGIIAGAKYDTKIGPLKALYQKADHLILGGLLYNTFISAKYGIEIQGVSEEDRNLARELVALDEDQDKILVMPYIVEADTLEGRNEGQFRTIHMNEFKERKTYKYFLDIDPQSMQQERVRDVMASAGTIFTNAVMGLMPHFFEGTEALYRLIAANGKARKLFGGGDTLQELKNLCPRIYRNGLDNPDTYYFTGGGSVLSSIEQGSPYGLKPIKALMGVWSAEH